MKISSELNKPSLILLLVLIVFVSVFFYFKYERNKKAFKTIYVSDSADVSENIIWDREKNLVRPEMLPNFLQYDSVVAASTELNGAVYYTYTLKHQGGNLKRIYKYKYINENFYCYLNRDTVSSGDTVMIVIGVLDYTPEYNKIIISNNEIFTVSSKKLKNYTEFKYKAYDFKSSGIHTFRAKVKLEDSIKGVNYNFVVE
jgi:hypothetical protein